MIDRTDSVYVVALGGDTPSWSKISWRDIVSVRHCYFHPVGRSNFPKQAVRWLGFRYDGRLQSIHRVEGVVEVPCRSEFSRHVPEIDGEACRQAYDHGERVPHFVYTLGSVERPTNVVRSGKIFGPGHLEVDRDLLLSSKTVREAFDRTRERHRSRP